MKLALMWAMSRNRTIGQQNRLPWHLPEDLKYFKRVTMGKPIIMGRKTWDSLGRPLPGRSNIVISRDPDFEAPGGLLTHSLPEAVALARKIAAESAVDEAVIIGGAEIFAMALPMAERLYLTEIHADVPGDTFFPDFDVSRWQETAREDFTASGDNPFDYSFVVLDQDSVSSPTSRRPAP